MNSGSVEDVRRYVDIVRTLARREFVGRFRGNLLGFLPALLVPMLFLITYTFVFSTLIPVRIRPGAGQTEYGFFLFAGLVGWNLFSETAARASRLFSDQAHFVRKARFPASTLAAASCLAAWYHSLLWVTAFAIARLVLGESLPPTILLSPLVLVVFAVFSIGVSLILASLGAFVRDLSDLIGPILTLGMFVSPVFYPADRIEAAVPLLTKLNPLVPQLEMMRAMLLEGTLPSGMVVASALAWCVGFLAVGALLHARVRPLLADVV